MARTSWAAAGLEVVLNSRAHLFQSAANFIFDVCSTENSFIAGRVLMLMWCIWQNRNDMVWNNHTLVAYQLGQQAFNMWKDWFDAQQRKQPNSNNNTLHHSSRWQKPTQGWTKCNIDAGFFMAEGITSLACCFRNAAGEFLKAQTKWINTKLSTIEGEGMAFLEAVSFAVHNRWDRIIFESDSQILVDSIRANQVGVSEFSYIINRIRASLFCINNFEVKFVRRQANMVAHSLARAAIYWASHHVLDMSPPCIDSLLINEKS